MASLLGKADATLVQAATKAAMANVPHDLSRIHERMSRSHAQTMRAIGKAWSDGITAVAAVGGQLIEQAKKRKINENLIDSWMGPQQNLEEGDTTPTSSLDYTDKDGNKEIIQTRTIRGQIKNIRKEILGIKRNKDLSREERKLQIDRLKNKKDNLKSAIVEFGSTLEVMTEHLKLNNIDTHATGIEKMLFARSVLNDGKPLGEDAGDYAGARAQVGFTKEKGMMTFTFVDKNGKTILDSEGNEISIQPADAQDFLVVKNPQIETSMDLLTDKQKNRKVGQQYGEAYDVTPVNSFVEKKIVSRNDFLNASNHIGPNMNSSLVSALHGVSYNDLNEPIIGPTLLSSGVFGELNILPESLDFDKSGTVDELDFKTKDNYMALASHVLSGKDLNLSKQVLKAHMVNIASGQHQLGVNAYNINKNKGSGRSLTTREIEGRAIAQAIKSAEENDFTFNSLQAVTLDSGKEIIRKDGKILLVNRNTGKNIATIDPTNKIETRRLLENHSASLQSTRTGYDPSDEPTTGDLSFLKFDPTAPVRTEYVTKN